MNITQQLHLLERLDQLIRLKATGTPTTLAKHIGMSKRQLHRLVQALREMGLPIEYCKKQKCYQYTDKVKIWVELQIGEETMLKIKGGKSFSNFFDTVPDYGTEPIYL
jgi:biotin operon repressor